MQELKNYLQDEEGMGTVEVILIIVVLVGLVLIFKKQITTIINDLFDSIVTKSAEWQNKKIARLPEERSPAAAFMTGRK